MPPDAKILAHVEDENGSFIGYFALTRALRDRIAYVRRGFPHMPSGCFVTFKLKIVFIEWHNDFGEVDWDDEVPHVGTPETIDPYKNPVPHATAFLNVNRNGMVSFELYVGGDGSTTHYTRNIGTVAALDKVFRDSRRTK